jgi:hypothetical protein
MKGHAAKASAAMMVLAAGSVASAQLRVATWNVSTYTSGRTAEMQTAVYGVFQGRSMSPDVLIGQEYVSAAAVTVYLSILNTAPGSPGDWGAAPFFNGNDTDNAFFYRTSKVQFLAATVVSVGSGGLSNHPRDVTRYDVRPVGYTGAGATLACYSTHMKAGSSTDDQNQRLIEANAIRANSQGLNAAWNYILAGDFNIQSSNQAAYQSLLSTSPSAGRFVDPIATPGSWNNSSTYRFVHTQSPGGLDPGVTGGMDDRFDFILLSPSLANGSGFDYIGNAAAPYSTSTWNDPNHSYRCWGNDGTSFNDILTISGNAMVGSVIAQALHDAPGGDGSGGHLPVFLDLRVPPEVASVATIDFGQVALNSVAQQPLNVSNSGDVVKWTATGIATLIYSLASSAGVTAPGGSFNAPAGGAGNNHTITIDTSTPGLFNGTVTINSNSPDEPARVVTVTAEVVSGTCYPNCDQSTGEPVLTPNDFQCFLNAYVSAQSYANCDGSTGEPALTPNDFQCFLNAYVLGCS